MHSSQWTNQFFSLITSHDPKCCSPKLQTNLAERVRFAQPHGHNWNRISPAVGHGAIRILSPREHGRVKISPPDGHGGVRISPLYGHGRIRSLSPHGHGGDRIISGHNYRCSDIFVVCMVKVNRITVVTTCLLSLWSN